MKPILRVFLPILEKLSYALDNSLLHAEEEAKFSEVAGVFVNHCVEFVRKHRFVCIKSILASFIIFLGTLLLLTLSTWCSWNIS